MRIPELCHAPCQRCTLQIHLIDSLFYPLILTLITLLPHPKIIPYLYRLPLGFISDNYQVLVVFRHKETFPEIRLLLCNWLFQFVVDLPPSYLILLWDIIRYQSPKPVEKWQKIPSLSHPRMAVIAVLSINPQLNRHSYTTYLGQYASSKQSRRIPSCCSNSFLRLP